MFPNFRSEALYFSEIIIDSNPGSRNESLKRYHSPTCTAQFFPNTVFTSKLAEKIFNQHKYLLQWEKVDEITL